jgi:thiosulfate reductase/polysulfide reductase chain A
MKDETQCGVGGSGDGEVDDRSSLSRRSLLKGLGLTTAATAGAFAGGYPSEAKAFGVLPTPYGLEAEREIPSYCEICFWNCGLVAHVRKNRVLHLSGHPDYPNAKGKLCGRGNAGPGFVRDEDRLKYPLRRVGKRGEGRFERIGWKTAYRLIAEGFAKIKAKRGAQALACFYHGKSGPYFRNMLAAYGSANYAAPAYAQCKGPRDVGYKLTFGTALSTPEPLDFANTKCMVFFGSHLGENAHNGQVQEFVQARARGAHLIVLDPRMSVPAARADIWMPVEPGTDTAVILAWMHLLIANGRYDKAFVEHQCVGFEQLKAHVKPFTPQWAAKEAGVEVKQIVDAYELMAKSKPAVLIHPGRHVAWYGEQDTQRARAQAVLNALLGSFWAKGGTFRPSKPNLSPWPTPDYPDWPKTVDAAAGRFPFRKEQTTNGIRDATRTGKPYPIKGWLVVGSNLIQSLPNVNHTKEAIDQLDFLAVVDIQPTEITQYADVLLPEDTYLERYDDIKTGIGTPQSKPYIGLRQPVVKSPYDTRPGWRMAKELAGEMGVGDFFAFDTFEEYLTTRLKGTGVTLEQLKKRGVHFMEPKHGPYLESHAHFHWHTPSGKVELYSKQMADKGFAALPTYVAQPKPPKGWLRLTYGRSPLHTFGRTQNIDILNDLDPGNCIWLNPACAKHLGIKEGRHVIVENENGARIGPLPAKITERILPQTIYMIHGFGHDSKRLRKAFGLGGSDTVLIDNYAVDPISGGTGMRVQFVRVIAADSKKELYPCAMG